MAPRARTRSHRQTATQEPSTVVTTMGSGEQQSNSDGRKICGRAASILGAKSRSGIIARLPA